MKQKTKSIAHIRGKGYPCEYCDYISPNGHIASVHCRTHPKVSARSKKSRTK